MNEAKSVLEYQPTSEGLKVAIRQLSEELAKLHGNLAPDTGAALLFGGGRTDARVQGSHVQIGLDFFGGWVVSRVDIAQASQLAGAIAHAVAGILHVADAQAAVASGAATAQ